MKLRANWFLVILVLIAICVSGWTSLEARQGTTSTQWEYTLIYLHTDEEAPARLNEQGMQGWELVGVTDGRAYFKRQKK